MLVKYRITEGSGPHAAKMEVYYNKKWHFVKWIGRKEYNARYSKKKSFFCHLKTTSSSKKSLG